MAKNQQGSKTSIKHIQIDKAQARIAATIAILVFVIVLSVVLARSLWLQRSFQAKVIREKETAVNQLNDNLEAANRLEMSYRAFIEVPTNTIGGITEGEGDRDGDNAKIILDALPSQYDYPALLTSIEKILIDHGYDMEAIAGQDALVEQVDQEESSPVEMPFEFAVRTTPSGALEALKILERSIRPFHVTEVKMAVEDDIVLSINAYSYYQPEERLKITTKEVRE